MHGQQYHQLRFDRQHGAVVGGGEQLGARVADLLLEVVECRLAALGDPSVSLVVNVDWTAIGR